MTPLRIQADDPNVLDRTAAALLAARDVKPRLRFRCRRCRKPGNPLAEVGDVPGYGPLFTSTWDVEPEDHHRVVVNGRELKGRERQRWLAERYEVEESGEPIDAPLKHGVVALLALPAGMTQDYPDLLMRCDVHGDHLADRLETLKQLRAARKPTDIAVEPIGGENTYTIPARLPGGELKLRRVIRGLRVDTRPLPTTAAELQARKAEQAAHLKRRREQRNAP